MVRAQHSDPGQLRAHYTDSSIVLDGRLNEQAWKKADAVSNFTQRELNAGEPATEQTHVAVVYTRRYLYIGAWCYYSSGKVTARSLERDFGLGKDDNFKLILDTYHDHRNAFLFITNPLGARRDAQVFNNGAAVNNYWDGVWDVETKVRTDGWFAEMRIPLSTLKYPDTDSLQEWGINFERNIRRKREQVLWQGWSRDASIEQVNRAGSLTNLRHLRNKDFVELKPYGIGGYQKEPGSEEGIGDVGGDINYLITPAMQAKVTVNTDFAQVENDRQQINLTRFPLFFPERREFFLEGQDYFNMGFGGNRITPFYSRRIGLTEDRRQVPILGGARLLGKVNDATLGFMSLQEDAKGGKPMTNYTIGSWRQNVLEQSSLGIMSVNKFTPGRWHTTTGLNGRYNTSKLFGNKNFGMTGAYIQTYNSTEEFQSRAHAWRVAMEYPNDKISFYTSAQRSPKEFLPEVALQRRENFREIFGALQLKPRPQNTFTWIRQFNFQPFNFTYTAFDDNGALQTLNWRVTPLGFDTRSGESIDFIYERSAEGVRDTFELQRNVEVLPGEYWQTRYEIQGSTFQGRALYGDFLISWGDFFRGSRIKNTYSLNWRTSRYLKISLDYERNWITMPEKHFVTNLWGSRLAYAFNPDLFGSVLGQWNSERKLFNLNYRLEWIPTPGTNVFLIWNQNWDTSGEAWASQRTTLIAKVIWRFVL